MTRHVINLPEGALPFGLHEPTPVIFWPRPNRALLAALSAGDEVYGQLSLIWAARICATGAAYFHRVPGGNFQQMFAAFHKEPHA
jgi:hypothetical protein